ncbi:MAG: acetoacetate--CoA ligase, partial [Gammaproteobacteria bacterium]
MWSPDKVRCAATNMQRFQLGVAAKTGLTFTDYDALHRWSIENPAIFWAEIAAFCEVQFDVECTDVLIHTKQMADTRWFVGAQLNFAANLLKFRDARPAIIFRDETGRRAELSYAQLYRQVAELADGLRQAGIVAGDRVAGFVPNCPEAVIAMLATTSLGAIWSSCSPDFGVSGVLDRFNQIRPRVLFATDGYCYGGKRIDCMPVVTKLAQGIDGLEHVVVFPFLTDTPNLNNVLHATHWSAFTGTAQEIEFASLPFDHPVYIMYSSGTTGKPKCIIHGAGGALLQHLKEHQLHSDLGRDDRFFFFTTCGWMMWNWLISGLATGATIVLYDGSPFEPDPGALWRLADEEGITLFGTGAKYLASLEKSGFSPREQCSLDALQTIQSTGSPLAPISFDFVYNSIKPDVALQSIAGGTDLLGCFVLGNPLGAVYRGELQCHGLGMAVAIVDAAGNELPVGEKGELVCTQPFPSMPVGFWNDSTGEKYHAAYFERFANVWAHGDYAALTEHGGLVIYGRSDATLNPGGVRIGTAEIYRQVEKIDEVLDCVAVGQSWQDDVRIILFIVLRDGVESNQLLHDRIRKIIRDNASPRHVPAKICVVADIPRTRSGKVV